MPQTSPLDPDSPGGRAAAEALTEFLAWIGPRVRQRRREREAAEARQSAAPLGVPDVASTLRISRASATRLASDSGGAASLKAKKDAGVWQVDRRDLAAYISQQAVTPDGQEHITVTAGALPRLNTLEEVSAQTGLPLSWLDVGCRNGLLPHVRAGRVRLMTQDQVNRTIEIASVAEKAAADPLASDRAAYASGRRASRAPATRRT